MITATVAGNVGKDAELRRAGDSDVLGFSVASEHPKDKNETIWIDVSIWGKRGIALEKHIRKGEKITVVGQLSTREHEGKTYLKLDAFDVALQGSPRRDDGDDRDRRDSRDDRRSDSRRDDRDRDRRDDRGRDDDRRRDSKDNRKGDDLPY